MALSEAGHGIVLVVYTKERCSCSIEGTGRSVQLSFRCLPTLVLLCPSWSCGVGSLLVLWSGSPMTHVFSLQVHYRRKEAYDQPTTNPRQ